MKRKDMLGMTALLAVIPFASACAPSSPVTGGKVNSVSYVSTAPGLGSCTLNLVKVIGMEPVTSQVVLIVKGGLKECRGWKGKEYR